MGEESSEMHSEDDKALLEKNKKRIVKTPAQVEALEKFYNEHKYPSEAMKIQVAESIGLTEKQVSGWFCHRRLKDKKVLNGENNATGRQERSSVVIQDRGSGLRQDSCGSTKQGDDRNFDTREVESGILTPKEFSAADVTYEHGSNYAGNYNRVEKTSSGSSSSLRNMANDQNGDPFDAPTSRYLIPKFPTDVKGLKPRSGPSGYLKVKGRQAENPAITAVKRQLGKHYREDGPPLGVEFDPLPPGAFESTMQEPVEETQYAGEADFPASPDPPKIHQNPKLNKGFEFKSSMASYNSNIDSTSFKKRRERDIADGYINQKFRPKTSLSNSGTYYPRRSSSAELPEGFAGVEVMKMGSVSIHHNLQPYDGKVRVERTESWLHKYNDVGTKENSENEYSNLIVKGQEYHNSGDKVLSRRVIKEGNMYHPDRRIINDNRVKVPIRNDLPPPKRLREDFPQQRHVKTSPVVDNLPQSYQTPRSAAEMPSSFSEDDESAETSSSMD